LNEAGVFRAAVGHGGLAQTGAGDLVKSATFAYDKRGPWCGSPHGGRSERPQ
jgi:hypothetical protein